MRREEVAYISLEDLRLGGPDRVAAQLRALRRGRICVIDGVSYRDIEVLVAGMLQAEAAGGRYLYRTAASFVRVRAGLAPCGLLTSPDLDIRVGGRGGLIVVGSVVQKSTAQMEAAQALPGIVSLELLVDRLLAGDARKAEILHLAVEASDLLGVGQDVCIYTSRRLVRASDPKLALQTGRLISSALAEIVSSLTPPPAWIIAKGGITSSDIATEGLRAKRATVLGQALPGVPVWRLEEGSRWPGLIYVVFPGNVGDSRALAGLVQMLRSAGAERSRLTAPNPDLCP